MFFFAWLLFVVLVLAPALRRYYLSLIHFGAICYAYVYFVFGDIFKPFRERFDIGVPHRRYLAPIHLGSTDSLLMTY